MTNTFLTPISHPHYFFHTISRRRATTLVFAFFICFALLIRVKHSRALKPNFPTIHSQQPLTSIETSNHAAFPRAPHFPFRRNLASLRAWQLAKSPLNYAHSRIPHQPFRQISLAQYLSALFLNQNAILTAAAINTIPRPRPIFRVQSKNRPSPRMHPSKPVPGRSRTRKGDSPLLFTHSLQNPPGRNTVRNRQAQYRKPNIAYEAHSSAPDHQRRGSAHSAIPYRDAVSVLSKETTISSIKSTSHSNKQDSIHSTVHDQRPKVALRSSQPVNPPLAITASPMIIVGREVNANFRSKGMVRPKRKGTVEIWKLHSGGSLCRIFNVARLPQGRLLLPKWMGKHGKVLLQQCGVKDPVFAIKSPSDDKQLVLDKKRLNMSGEICIINKANLDLFSSAVPRHHMPHFVSDILFPLAATEILKGSGTSVAKHGFIRTNSSSSSFEETKAAAPDLSPSFFLREETWQAEASGWVRRLVNLFSHPEVGFSLLGRKENRTQCNSMSYNKSNVMWRFRSVLTGSLNVNEGEGLFDKSGNNFVFSRNGLSIAPAWAINGVSHRPCRVAVTALTRSGPRALLNLDFLKHTTEQMFVRGGLELDFKVVKFERAVFNTQVQTMQRTNVLIATHGAGNANLIFLRREATIIEVFPFAYRAGPFNALARTFGLDYKTAMSTPQTKVFKECMDQHETNNDVKQKVFGWWDGAVAEEKRSPWIHRLELEKEFGEPGKAEGMATRRCVRAQQLDFDTKTVAAMVFESAKRQCSDLRIHRRSVQKEKN